LSNSHFICNGRLKEKINHDETKTDQLNKKKAREDEKIRLK
jgi:hypothetical protein